jgi:spore maturation protein CgeB
MERAAISSFELHGEFSPADVELMIIGYGQPGHLGAYLASAADRLKLRFDMADAAEAESPNRLIRSFYWRFRDRRPPRLAAFADRVVEMCSRKRVDLLLSTGRAPLSKHHLEKIRRLGTVVVNYSTDDPWNPGQRAQWFLEALPSYNRIFTPRRANLDEFLRNGVQNVNYMPFGYDEEIHRPLRPTETVARASDLLFVGGCDADRLPLISALIDAGVDVALFGGYWDRHKKTATYARGIADQSVVRAASASARVNLCLVRRANRDEHVMRSFEAAAIGGCILAEDTIDHRALFRDGAQYFKTVDELVQLTKDLIANPQARNQLSSKLAELMAAGEHTYSKRLESMLTLSLA